MNLIWQAPLSSIGYIRRPLAVAARLSQTSLSAMRCARALIYTRSLLPISYIAYWPAHPESPTLGGSACAGQ